MKRISLLMLMLALNLSLWAETSEAERKRAKAEAKLAEAVELQKAENFSGALKAFFEAVEADPKWGEIRLKRGSFISRIYSYVESEEARNQLYQVMISDFQYVVQADPDGVNAGVAKDALKKLLGKDFFPSPEVECSPEANEAYNAAENNFHNHLYDQALKHYKEATELCPDNAEIMIFYADAYFLLKKYDLAVGMFSKGLKIDPWHKSGHRFLADTYIRLGEGEAAYQQLILAVLSDPTYEAGWDSLQGVTEKIMEGQFYRVVADPEKQATVKADGPDIQIILPSGDEKDPDSSAWLTFGLFQSITSDVMRKSLEDDAGQEAIDLFSKFEDKKYPSLSAIKVGVDAGLSAFRDGWTKRMAKKLKKGKIPLPFWGQMSRAEKAGFLNEAIFLHLMNEKLAPDYVAYRNENRERLLEYMQTIVVPIPEKK